MVNGKKHGYWITYFANGLKRSEGNFIHGKKDCKKYRSQTGETIYIFDKYYTKPYNITIFKHEYEILYCLY